MNVHVRTEKSGFSGITMFRDILDCKSGEQAMSDRCGCSYHSI